jgi:hypothetical protein
MNFKDLIYEILINENTDKKKTIERAMGFSPAWAEEFYQLSEKHCIWVANSFLNDYVVTHKKSIEKKANKRFKEEKDLKRAAREILNTSGPRNLIWKEDYEEKYKYIFDWLSSPRVASRVNVKILSFKDALEKSTIWHESLETGVSANYNEEHEIILDYRKNGVGFYWANLNTSMSEEEKRRMGHCGNDSGKVLFSLRSIDEIKDGRSHVTISYDPKTRKLGQMKGPQNRKPKQVFFKFIIDMLLNNKYPVVGFEKNIYAYDQNFQLEDLSKDELNHVLSNNREIKLDYVFGDKKRVYTNKDNTDVILFKEDGRSNTTKHYGVVNVETLEVIKDYEYLLDETSDFTDNYIIDGTWYQMKDFKSVKTNDDFIIFAKLGESPSERKFQFLTKQQAQELVDKMSPEEDDDEDSIAK